MVTVSHEGCNAHQGGGAGEHYAAGDALPRRGGGPHPFEMHTPAPVPDCRRRLLGRSHERLALACTERAGRDRRP
eukprot:6411314-Pyramimonas_sp.AAC.1